MGARGGEGRRVRARLGMAGWRGGRRREEGEGVVGGKVYSRAEGRVERWGRWSDPGGAGRGGSGDIAGVIAIG